MSAQAIEQTRLWLKDWVIGLDLCPFARYPFEKGKVRIVATESEDSDEIFKFVLTELDYLYQEPAEQIETTLLVVENALQSFPDYLGFLSLLEHVLPQAGLEGVIQVASFHPDYCFEGESQDDPANATNRSPYPMFHLIRENSLEKALKTYPNPEKIPERNISLLRDNYAELARKQGKNPGRKN